MRWGGLLLVFLVACGGRTDPLRVRGIESADDAGTFDAASRPGAGRRDAGPCLSATRQYAVLREFSGDAQPNAREEFDNESPSFEPVEFPFETQFGLRFVDPGPGAVAQVLDEGAVTPQIVLHLRDFGTGLTVEVPGTGTALGFDYETEEEGWRLVVENQVYELTSFSGGDFIGLFNRCGGLSQVRIVGPGGAQAGLTLDRFRWRE